jgi:DNA helicase-2/ATP-dependent DNA helicase PcrA
MTVPALIDLVCAESGYRDALRAERTAEAQARLENLEELVAASEEFIASQEAAGGDPVTLEAFLDSVMLVADTDELESEPSGVTLMTLHSAKGLEFPLVFLTGMEEGVFPHARSMNDPEEIEEERRPLLRRDHPGRRPRCSSPTRCIARIQGYGLGEPSRFLLEIPDTEVSLLRGRGTEPRAPVPVAAPVPAGTPTSTKICRSASEPSSATRAGARACWSASSARAPT